MERFTPVLVEWVDCSQRQTWRDYDEVMKPISLTCFTVAFFIEWRSDCIVLCQSLAHIENDKPETIDSTLYIPKVAVKKVRVLQ